MYGYIRPSGEGLAAEDREKYSEAYCGLCHALGEHISSLARLTVSYDLTFLAMLLSENDECCCSRRCPRHLLRKKRCLCGGSMVAAAELGTILFWWKLRDAMQDERGLRRLGSRLASLFLRQAYRRAAERNPAFDALTKKSLEELAVLENARSDSLDRTADCFARILSGCSEAGREEDRRILAELLYHVGRCIYIMDAADDVEEDRKAGHYNPLLCRFESWDDEAKDKVRFTVGLSVQRAAAALALLPENRFSAVTENIITKGIPQATELILRGEWKNKKKYARKYQKTHGSDKHE